MECLKKTTITEYFGESINFDNGISASDIIAFAERANESGFDTLGLDHEYDDNGEYHKSSTLIAYFERDETDEELAQRQKNWDEWQAMPKPILIPRSWDTPRIEEIEGGGYNISLGGMDVIWPKE